MIPISRVGDTVFAYHWVFNQTTGAAITNLTAENWTTLLTLDGNVATEEVSVAHISAGLYGLSFVPQSPGTYSMQAKLLDNFDGSDGGGFEDKQFSVLPQGAPLPWLGEGLCGLDDVKTALGEEDTYNDTLIQELIAAVTETIQKEVGIEFENHTTVPTRDAYDGNGRADLFLWRRYKVVGVDGVWINGEGIDAAEDATSCGYMLDGRTLRLRGMRFPPGVLNVEVATRWGYAYPPADARNICLSWTILRYKELTEHPGQHSKVIGDQRVNYLIGPYSEAIGRMIDNLRNMGIA